MHILCTQKLVRESSPKPLVAQRRTRLELLPRRARRAGQPEETPGGGRTGRPGRPTRPAGRARRRRERRTTASGGNSGRRDDRETGSPTADGQTLRTTSITIDGTTCRSAGRGRPRADAVRVGGNPAPSRSGTSAAERATGRRGRTDASDRRQPMRSAERAGRPATEPDRATGTAPQPDERTVARPPPWAGRVRPAARTGGRAAGPLDLIHRGALRLFPGCPAGRRRRGTDTARRASHRPGSPRDRPSVPALPRLRSMTESRPERGGARDFHGRVTPEYAPDRDGEPDPGEVVWAWVPYEEDPEQGKDRPVVIVGRAVDDPRDAGRRSCSRARGTTATRAGTPSAPARGTASTDRAGCASTARSPSPRTPYAARARPSTPRCSSPSSSTQRP